MTTLAFEQALLPGGWASDVSVTFQGGRITGVISGAAPPRGAALYAIGLPGLPNLHSHGFQRGMAGLSERRGDAADSFWTWREVMYRFLDSMAPEDVEALSAQAYVEMVEAGFTRVGEFHYLHNDASGASYANPAELCERVAAAASSAGIRLTLLPVFYAHATFGGAPPDPAQRRFVLSLDAYARLLAAARGLAVETGVAPHSLRAVAPHELAAICTLAGDGPIHIHAAEQVREVDDCLAWSGARPVQWLLDHASVDARWCIVHATHMLPQEAARLAATRAVVALCPVTEANLGDGIFDGAAWVAAQGRYGVATDSNVSVDAAGELRLLEYAQRLGRRGRNLMAPSLGQATGRVLFDNALAAGSVLGASPTAIAPGAPADLIALDATHPSLRDKRGDALLDSWIFATTGRAIDSVWIGGRQLVRQGRHIARDAVAEAYASALKRLLAQ